MSRPSFHWLFSNSLLTGLLVLTISGCGGSSEDSDTQAAAGGDMSSQPGYPEDYSGEPGSTSEPGAAYGGGAYGGGTYGGGRSGQGGSGGYGDSGYPGPGMEGGYEGGLPEDSMGYAGYSGESTDSESGYPGDMSGYGAGMAGYGGGSTNPQFGTMIQFVRQNCVQCHGQRLVKGDTRLDRLTANFEDQRNATLWHAVLEQLESGQMPPKSIPQRPDPRQQEALVSWLRTSLRDASFVPLEEQDYLSQAEYAFASAREAEAVKLLYAHTLAVEDEAAQEFLSQAKWSTVGMRPVLSMRFAVGVILSAPEDLKDISPLGSTPTGAGGGGYGGESYGTPGNNTSDSGERTFQQLTGAFGEALVTNFEKRWVEGSLGTIFKDTEEAAAAPAPGIGGEGYGGPGYAGGGYGGYEGSGYDGGMNYGGAGAGMGGENAASQRGPVTPGSRITPGLHFIGMGNQAELLKQAAELGVDGLFVFDVKAEQDRRRGFVNNDTRMRLVSLSDAKTLAATSNLNNIDIARNKARGLEDDSLDKNIQRFFAMFDERVRLESLPALKAEHAQSRMRQLLVDQNSSKLSKLFEARLYHSLDLLSSEELSMLYQIVLLGNEGVALTSGTVDDRRLVLDAVLAN